MANRTLFHVYAWHASSKGFRTPSTYALPASPAEHRDVKADCPPPKNHRATVHRLRTLTDRAAPAPRMARLTAAPAPFTAGKKQLPRLSQLGKAYSYSEHSLPIRAAPEGKVDRVTLTCCARSGLCPRRPGLYHTGQPQAETIAPPVVIYLATKKGRCK